MVKQPEKVSRRNEHLVDFSITHGQGGRGSENWPTLIRQLGDE